MQQLNLYRNGEDVLRLRVHQAWRTGCKHFFLLHTCRDRKPRGEYKRIVV